MNVYSFSWHISFYYFRLFFFFFCFIELLFDWPLHHRCFPFGYFPSFVPFTSFFLESCVSLLDVTGLFYTWGITQALSKRPNFTFKVSFETFWIYNLTEYKDFIICKVIAEYWRIKVFRWMKENRTHYHYLKIIIVVTLKVM